MSNPERHVPVCAANVKYQLQKVRTRIDKNDPNYDNEVQICLDVAIEKTEGYIGIFKTTPPAIHNAIVMLAAAIFNRRETPSLYWELIAPYRKGAF